jgi:hypothetical protein
VPIDTALPLPYFPQNMAEIMEYTDQLDKAATTEDPYERWVG